MDMKRMAAWPRAWRWLACAALAGWLALPASVQASPGCQALNGLSGTLAAGDYLGFLDNSQPVNQGDSVTLTVSGGQGRYVGSFLTMTSSGSAVTGVESGSGASADGLNNIGSTTISYSITCLSVAPAALSISPSSGYAGSTVAITGNGLWGTTGVRFGGIPAASFTVGNGASGTAKVSAIVPNGAGTAVISVTNDGGTTSGPNFTFLAPTAGPVSATVALNSSNNPITLNLGGTPSSVAVASAASHGTATATGTSITYTPSHDYAGSDSFSYTATSASGTSSPGTVTITVSQGAQTITFNNPGAVNFGTSPQLNASSNSGLPVSYSSVTTNICTVTSTGVLSAIAPGNCTINANQAGNAAWQAAPQVSQSFSIVVPGAAVSFVTLSQLPNTMAGAAYSTTITATGGFAPYSFQLISGALPTGLFLSAVGTLAGTPTSVGTYNVTVRVTDSATQTADKTFQLTVNAPAVTITPATLPQGKVGASYASTTLTASGGTAAYTYAVTAGALPPGLSLSPAGVLSGTPSTAGSFNVTVTATDKFNFQGTQAYTITVGQGTPVVTNGTVSTNANTPVTIPVSSTGGPITSVAVSAQPAHGTATVNGLNIVYTPTNYFYGSDSLSYTATGPGGTSATATLSITVIPGAVPTVTAQNAALVAGQSITINTTTGAGNGPFTGVAIATQPSSGTAAVQGTNIVYTAAADGSGTVSFDYTVSNAYGASLPARITVTINQLPVAAAQSATVLAGQSVTIHTTAGATNGPFVSAAVVTPPSTGTAVTQGTDVVYTAPTDAAGTFGFDYTVSNAYGASKPAHVTLTVNAAPTAPNLNATVIAGKTVQVDLTASAHGGPFSAAKLVSVSPSNAGSASIQAGANGYTLSFTAAATFSGSAQLNYALSNAFAVSAPGIITVAVTPRSDPSRDAEVLGVLDAQADAARRMATGQIDNFQRRLETLHGGGASGFSNGITMSSASSQRDPQTFAELGQQSGMNRYRVAPDADESQTPVPASTLQGGSLPGGLAVWTGGAVNFGKMQTGASDNGIDFTTSGLSMGVDKAFSSSFAAGLGVGYGHDVSDVGQHGSRSALDSYNVAFYASYHPANSVYVDGLLGYQWLNFDARRYVTDDGNTVHGNRDGTQEFASVSVGYQHQADDMQLTPYGRLDIARAHLDGYTENGDATYALAYQHQTVNTTTGTLGVLAQWTVKQDYGVWSPRLRAEFGHDMQGSDAATMRYADLLNGPLYQATLTGQSRNHSLLGAGVSLQTLHGWLLRVEYQAYLDNSSSNNQSVLLGVEKKFEP